MKQIETDNQTDKIQQLLLALGKAYLERQQYAQALEKFRQLLDMGVENSDVTLHAAQAALALQDVSEQAQQIYQKALAFHPNSRILRTQLAGLFSQFELSLPFAIEIDEDTNQIDPTAAAETVPDFNLPEADANVFLEQLEQLWWQEKFDEALERLQTIPRANGQDTCAVELALTHAYRAIAEKTTICDDRTAAVILNGLEMLSPGESLKDLRHYLTLRMALPELVHGTTTSPDESEEYQFILGLVSMEDFFSRLKNGSARDGFILKKFDLKKEILDVLDGHAETVKSPISWRSVLVAEIQTDGSLTDELTSLIRSFSEQMPKSVLRLSGNGFIVLAADPLEHINLTLQFLKEVVVFNRSFHESHRVTLKCGLAASSTSKNDEELLTDLVKAAHLLRVATAAEQNSLHSGLLILTIDPDLQKDLIESGLSLTPIKDAPILPGHTSTCYQVNWFNPLDFIDDGHPYKAGDFLIETRLATRPDYATFAGIDRRLGRRLLFKIISPQKAVGYLDEPEKKENLFKTLRGIGRLSHPHIATLFDLGEQDGMIYFVREHIEGKPITEIELAENEFDTELVTLVLKIVRALMYARNQGIHHLNLKPGNVLVNESRVLKLTDFYCPHFTDRSDSEKYFAPEFISIGAGDERSDIYSIGVILNEIIANRLSQLPLTKSDWQNLVRKAAHSDPGHRFQNLNEMEMELRRIQIKLMEPPPTTPED